MHLDAGRSIGLKFHNFIIDHLTWPSQFIFQFPSGMLWCVSGYGEWRSIGCLAHERDGRNDDKNLNVLELHQFYGCSFIASVLWVGCNFSAFALCLCTQNKNCCSFINLSASFPLPFPPLSLSHHFSTSPSRRNIHLMAWEWHWNMLFLPILAFTHILFFFTFLELSPFV